MRLVDARVPGPTRVFSLRRQGWDLWRCLCFLLAGLELRRPWAAWLSICLEKRRTHGTCWWRTTSTLKPVALSTVQYCSPFVLCATCNVPLSWNKTAGGDTEAWVGFELLHRGHQLGISQRRAERFIRWSRGVASSEFVKMSTFEEGLGRIAYVAGALENERPFLGPLYRFLTLHPRQSVRRVPPYVAFTLNHLSRQSERSRHYPCVVNQLSSDVSPRVDAQASDERTGIGGWYSPWFSMLVECEHFPWVFGKGGQASTCRLHP